MKELLWIEFLFLCLYNITTLSPFTSPVELFIDNLSNFSSNGHLYLYLFPYSSKSVNPPYVTDEKNSVSIPVIGELALKLIFILNFHSSGPQACPCGRYFKNPPVPYTQTDKWYFNSDVPVLRFFPSLFLQIIQFII